MRRSRMLAATTHGGVAATTTNAQGRVSNVAASRHVSAAAAAGERAAPLPSEASTGSRTHGENRAIMTSSQAVRIAATSSEVGGGGG